MTDTKDDEAASPEQISIAKNQAINKAFQDAFNARNNVQGLKNQKAMIIERNQAIAGQIEAAENAKAQAKEAQELAGALDKEVEAHDKQLEFLKEGLAKAEETIKKLKAVNVPTDAADAAKQRIAEAIATETKHKEAKEQISKGHQATAEAKHEQVQQGLTAAGDSHTNDVMQALQQIDTQIEANELTATQKQQEAEKHQSQSDDEWFKDPANKKAMKGLLTDAQKATMDKQDKDAAAGAKSQANSLVPDTEMKTLQGMVAVAKAGFQVATRLPDGIDGKKSSGEVVRLSNEVDEAYEKIDELRTKLASEAPSEDEGSDQKEGDQNEGDEAKQSEFDKKAEQLQQMVAEFKEKYSKGHGFDFMGMLPPAEDMKAAADKSAQLSGTQSKLLPIIGRENAALVRSALGKFPQLWTGIHDAAGKIGEAPGDAGADKWQKDIFAFMDKIGPFRRDAPQYKQMIDALAAITDQGKKQLAAEILQDINGLTFS